MHKNTNQTPIPIIKGMPILLFVLLVDKTNKPIMIINRVAVEIIIAAAGQVVITAGVILSVVIGTGKTIVQGMMTGPLVGG